MTKPYCSYSIDQVRDSGLLSTARMEAITAEIESRISEPRTADGRPITSAKLATFPDGALMLYPRMDHDSEGDYIRRELLGSILTAAELKLVNDQCHAGWTAAADAKRFEKATKLDSWDGWVTDGSHYWSDVETYLDERGDELGGAEEQPSTPPYLWVAAPQQVITHLDVSDVTEHLVCDRGWENMGVDDLEGVKDLQAALDAFVKANETTISYTPDYSRAVLLEPYLSAARDNRICRETGIHPSQR